MGGSASGSALVLLGAAAAKLRDPRALVAAVGDHGVPPRLRPPAAAVLVAAEVALGVLILVPATARAAGAGVAVLGLLFRRAPAGSPATASNCSRGRPVPRSPAVARPPEPSSG